MVGIILDGRGQVDVLSPKRNPTVAYAEGGLGFVLMTSEYCLVDDELAENITPEALEEVLAPPCRLTVFFNGSYQIGEDDHILALPAS